MQSIDPAATAWLLASTALVLLMTPGLAIFYGGMVRTTGVLNMIMMSFISIPLVTVVWLLAGYSLAFSDGTWVWRESDPTRPTDRFQNCSSRHFN